MLDRSKQAERLGDFFALQLLFAEHMAMRTDISFRVAVLKYTNFHRRFGLGDPDRSVSPRWESYVCGLEERRGGDRVVWTQEFYKGAPEEMLPLDQRFSGCFSCAAPDARGVVRLHFVNRDKDEVGPLHRSKVTVRKRDLAELVALIWKSYPTARSIVGMSWLYHLEAYRRLFPPEYGASPTPAGRVRFSGMSSWGQFLRHDGAIKPALRDAFLNNFGSMDVTAPWSSFPLPVLVASAPISDFYKFYGLSV